MQTVSINKRTWAVGFFWQPPEGPKKILKAARDRAREFNEEDGTAFDSLVVRKIGQPQIGFGSSGFEKPVPIPSLASALAQVKEGTWLGSFVFEEGVYVVGVLNGAILADGDFLGSPAAAKKRIADLTQMIDIGDGEGPDPWDDVIGGETIEESLELLEDILLHAKHVPKTTPVEPKRPIGKIVFCTIFVAATLISYNLYSNHLNEIRQAESVFKQKMLAQQAKIMAAKNAAKHKVVIPKPWQDAVLPSSFWYSCNKPYRESTMIFNGWNLERWSCYGSTIKKAWDRTLEGSFSVLPGRAVLDINQPTKATESGRIQAAFPPRGEQNLEDQQVVARKFYEFARRLKLNIGMRWEKPKPVTLDSTSKKRNVEPEMLPYVKAGWELKELSTFPDRVFGLLLDEIPGLIITEITFDKQKWHIRGVLYAKY
jgi:hypothetical protein